MTKIELDYKRLMDFQKVSNNLISIGEHFRIGDILVKEVNSILTEIKDLIDLGLETSFTKQDFNDILDLRNNVLAPILQNASFAAEFAKYEIPVEEGGTV